MYLPSVIVFLFSLTRPANSSFGGFHPKSDPPAFLRLSILRQCVTRYSLTWQFANDLWKVWLSWCISIFSTNKTDRNEIIEILLKERFENTKEFIRSHKLKNNTQSYKSTTQKTIECATSTLHRKKNGNELRCSGRVRISSSTSCTCSVALVKN